MRGLASGQALLVGVEARNIGVPVLGERAPLHLIDLGGDLGACIGYPLLPFGPEPVPALPDAAREMLVNAVRDQELRVLGPSIGTLGLAHLVLPQRLAVRLGRVLLVWRAPTDVAVDDDQRRTVPLLPELLERACQELEIVR